ncbi:MAG: hypothetical protein ABIB93_00775 [Chloroflexota bacterium]
MNSRAIRKLVSPHPGMSCALSWDNEFLDDFYVFTAEMDIEECIARG